MSISEQLALGEDEDDGFGGYFTAEAKAARRREQRRNSKTDYRRTFRVVPVKNGMHFAIVPEVAPILEALANRCAAEASVEDQGNGSITGTHILGARAAVVLGKPEAAVVRRLYAVLHRKQLFINDAFVQGCLMAVDAEHEFTYGVWPSCRADALERVSIEAELAGKKVSPTKLLARANRLYEKGIRKALKRAVEVDF